MARYIETIGRRKTASARVRLTPSAKESVIVNGKSLEDFFTVKQNAATAILPLRAAEGTFEVVVSVRGGGISGQAEAVKHGLARALIAHNMEFRAPLKKAGYLKRDPRAKERKKPGLKKARKAGQWSKR